MKPILPDYAQSGVLIIGDVMLDRYWYGPTGRISPEALFRWLRLRIMKNDQAVPRTLP